MDALEDLSFGRTVLDGGLLSAAFVLFILGTLRVAPRIWIGDLPVEIRALLPPLTPVERRTKAIAGVLLLAILFGGIAWSTYRLRVEAGSLPFPTAAAHIWILLAMVVLADTFVLDWLVLSVLRPRFATIPGTEPHLGAILRMSRFLSDMVKGLAGAVVVAAAIGLLFSR